MTRQVRLAFLMLALCWGAAPSTDARTLIYAGHLIDGISEQAVADQTVVVEEGRIVDILDGFAEARDGDDVIDLRKHTVLPGLMDMHTHLSHQGSRTSYLERFQLNPPDYAILSVVYAERTLLAGFTTVRDLGDIDNVTISLRNAIQRGLVPGPRIFTAGKSLATTGGHADRSNGIRASLQGDPGPKEGVVNSLDGAAQAVRYRYKDGADLIKITATGGVLSLAKNSQNPQFTEDLIRAVVATADDYGFIVAAHAHGAEGMKRAIRAGVRSIEHGTYMDDEAIASDERARHLLGADLAGRQVRRGEGKTRRLLPRHRAAQSRSRRATDAGHVRPGLSGRGQDRLRHRHRGLAPWRKRPRVSAHGGRGHAAHGSHPVGHPPRRRAVAYRGRRRHLAAGAPSRCHCRRRRSSRRTSGYSKTCVLS